ncbi:Alpha/Beta hydrolase protein [Chaetomium tenue]|uniref:Alpha/Beta hydrolase protein n=1 Tax=Chaetomium tenue TaxID=1854479 RepID=A0ACB7PKC0_9PEZI|nr:Alpha/Beta hydrolase protein [Chaetomium globosum]
MRFSILACSALLAPLTGARDPGKPEPPDHGLTVKTTSGTYTGFVDSTGPDVNQWLGIPYGRPPVGDLRFMPPKRAPDYGRADAKDYKPICFQTGNRTGAFWELMPEFQNTDPQSEDCLYLNIWGPRKPVEKKVPVIIWVCGGGFREGGGHAPYQVPDQWIQRTQTHIVVTFNYRLGIFGFPNSPIANKNAGLLDIRLVVEWLKDNVAGFGGDPNRMVLYGQSAGSTAVLSQAYAYPEKPIVRGFIASSAGIGATNPTNTTLFHDLAQTAGCANLTEAAELKCMQKVDAPALQKKVNQANTDPNRGVFRPIADGVSLFANLTERLEKGLVAKEPLITGFTYNEAAAFLPFNINATTPPDGAGAPGAGGLACGSRREMDARAAYGLPTYVYLSSGNFSNITPRYWLGGMHSSDIPLVFGTHYQFRGNSTELEWQTSFAMEAAWVSLAANPSADPQDHLGQKWPKYTEASRQVVVFGNATGPSAAYVAPAEILDNYSGPC